MTKGLVQNAKALQIADQEWIQNLNTFHEEREPWVLPLLPHKIYANHK